MQIREVNTCTRCRESKRRCDKLKPACSRCLVAGVACSFLDSSQSDASSEGPSRPSPTGIDTDSEPSRSLSAGYDFVVKPIPASGRIIKKRDRACLSCTRCHRLKVKCDKKEPCNRCARSGFATACIYTHKAHAAMSPGTPNSIIVSAGEDPESIVTTWFLRRRGSSHWRSLLSRVEALDGVGPEVFAVALREHSENQCLSDLFLPGNFPFGSPESAQYISLDDVFTLILGEQSRSRHYFNCYVDLYQAMYPILDVQVFQQDIDRFWASPRKVDLCWIAQYLIVLGLGAYASKTSQQLAKSFFFAGEACLAKTPYMYRPTVSNISTLCLMVVAKQIANATCWALDSCWNIMGIIVRLGIMMGLHFNGPNLYNTNDIARENEHHRRLWTIIVYLDIQFSLVAGQSSQLSNQAFPTSKDFRPPARMVTLGDCWMSVMPESFPIIWHFLGRLNSNDDPISYDEVLQYDMEIRKWMRRLVNVPGNETLRLTLDIFFRRVLSCLHRYHALHLDAPVIFPTSYWSSLECSLALLVHYRALSERHVPATSMDLIARPFMLDFFAAALTAAVHLTRADAPLDAVTTLDALIPPRQTIIETLKSCLELFSREKEESLCFRSGHRLLSAVCTAVWARLMADVPIQNPPVV